MKDEYGSFFVTGKRITGFTNEEEKAVHLADRVPFLLESKLIKEGALFYETPIFTSHVVVDGNLITGQNPQSSLEIAETIKQCL